MFYELCLVFGAKSAAGLFDRLAKLILHIVQWKCKMPARAVIQHLDDVCSASPAGSGRALVFHTCYEQVCEELGVKLAPPGDPDKAFGPSTEGIVLGVCYDTVSFTWYLREDKMSIILNMINNAIEDEEMTQRTVKKLCGKLIDIRVLVPSSKYYLANLIIDANQDNDQLDRDVTLTHWTRADLSWWKLVLPLFSHRTRLPDPDLRTEPRAVKVYSDAAGGTTESLGRGGGRGQGLGLPALQSKNKCWLQGLRRQVTGLQAQCLGAGSSADGSGLCTRPAQEHTSSGLCGQCWECVHVPERLVHSL